MTRYPHEKSHPYPRPMTSPADRKALIETALGKKKADRVVLNARLLNVYTGEVLDGQAVSMRGQWIAYVGEHPGPTIGDATDVIDARGRTLIPGLIDAHTHLAWLFTAHEFLKLAMGGGTTTLITETIEPFPVGGNAGLIDFLNSLADQPVKIFSTAPPMMSISRRARGISPEVLDALLKRPDILGLGESYWQSVTQETDRMVALFDQTLRAGKSIEGHSAGASEHKLNAYIAAGVSSCHEPVNSGEVIDRLRRGLHVMVREGSIRRDLKAISEILKTGIDTRRLILVTDGVEPGDLLKHGYMEYVVQKAIDLGFDPVSAVQMATLNPAEHFSLDGIIGGIAPGRQADLLVIPDLETIRPEVVISKGCVIARNGSLLTAPRAHVYLPASLNSIQLKGPLSAADFAIPAPADRNRASVRVMDLVTGLVTREIQTELDVRRGEIRCHPELDVIKISAIDRTHSPGKRFTGLIRGFGFTSGAMASSAAWDTSDIIVVGADESDMAKAVNRVCHLQGGVVVCSQGKILAELKLPIFGLMSPLPIAQLAHEIETVREKAVGLGFPHDDPLLTLITLTGQAIPFFRICEEGLVNFKDGKTLSLFANS